MHVTIWACKTSQLANAESMLTSFKRNGDCQMCEQKHVYRTKYTSNYMLMRQTIHSFVLVCEMKVSHMQYIHGILNVNCQFIHTWAKTKRAKLFTAHSHLAYKFSLYAMQICHIWKLTNQCDYQNDNSILDFGRFIQWNALFLVISYSMRCCIACWMNLPISNPNERTSQLFSVVKRK